MGHEFLFQRPVQEDGTTLLELALSTDDPWLTKLMIPHDPDYFINEAYKHFNWPLTEIILETFPQYTFEVLGFKSAIAQEYAFRKINDELEDELKKSNPNQKIINYLFLVLLSLDQSNPFSTKSIELYKRIAIKCQNMSALTYFWNLQAKASQDNSGFTLPNKLDLDALRPTQTFFAKQPTVPPSQPGSELDSGDAPPI